MQTYTPISAGFHTISTSEKADYALAHSAQITHSNYTTGKAVGLLNLTLH